MGPQNGSKMELQNENKEFLFSNELGNCFRETAIYPSIEHIIPSMGLTWNTELDLKINCNSAILLLPVEKVG